MGNKTEQKHRQRKFRVIKYSRCDFVALKKHRFELSLPGTGASANVSDAAPTDRSAASGMMPSSYDIQDSRQATVFVKKIQRV